MLFIVDFDGTISHHDTVDALLDQFADPAWKDIERAWTTGQLNSRDCMRSQIALVNADRATLEEYFQLIEIDPSFLEFVQYASTLGEVAVVSDGLDYPILHALQRYGITSIPVFANRLAFRARGLGMSFPHSDAACSVQSGVCKCAVARSLEAGRGLPCVLIGDGRSDQCISRVADYVFAKGSLRRYCQAEGIAHTSFESFRDVLNVIQNGEAFHSNLTLREPPCRLAMR